MYFYAIENEFSGRKHILGVTMKRTIIFVVVGFIVVFLLIQLMPYGHQHTNPQVIQEPNWDSPQTLELVQRACFDCHSNETVWPWYSNVAPSSWLVQRDVDVARRILNFSNWSQVRGIGEISEVVLEGEMPPFQYLILHPEARLTQAERQALVTGLQASVVNP
jgi:mono/diheme cytochrome c family protein